MSEKLIRYVVRYPKISTVISKEEIDPTAMRAYDPNEIFTARWEDAHAALLTVALQRVQKANEELTAAIAHLADVSSLRNPDLSQDVS